MLLSEDRSTKEPIYLRLQRILSAEVLSGRVSPGDRLTPENQLMDRFQVSRTTMRRALHGLEREGLIVRYPGKGTFVNRNGRRGERGRAWILGVNFISGHGNHHFHGQLCAGIMDEAERNGLQIQILSGQEDGAEGQDDLDGLLFVGDLRRTPEVLRRVSKGLLPAVGFNTRINRNVGFVGVDYREESRLGVEHLLRQGGRRIGFYGMAPEAPASEARYRGYVDALTAAGLPVLPRNLCFLASDDARERFGNILEFLKAAEVDSMFVSLGPIFTYLLRAMNELRIRTGDLKLLCFDDLAALNLNWPGVSYIRMPLRSIGERMVQALRQRILLKDMAPIVDEMFKAEIVTGE